MRYRIILTTFAALTLLVVSPAAPVFAEADADAKPVLTGPEAKPERGDKQRDRRKFDGKPQKGPRGHEMMKRLFKDIELTPEQKDAFRGVMSELQTEAKAFRDKNKEAMKAMHESYKSAKKNKDTETLKSLAAQRKKITDSRPKITDHMDKIKAILTKEQQTAFATNLEKMKEHMKDRGPKGKKGKKDGKGKGKGKNRDGGGTGTSDQGKSSTTKPANQGLEL